MKQYAIRVTNGDGSVGFWGPETTARPYANYSTAYHAAKRRFRGKGWKVVEVDCSGKPVKGGDA